MVDFPAFVSLTDYLPKEGHSKRVPVGVFIPGLVSHNTLPAKELERGEGTDASVYSSIGK